jgi:signal transduction histidine kinase
MFLFWGPDLIQFYNDAYRPSLGDGGRHPAALGMRGAEFWTEIWDIIGPQIEQVMGGGEATWHEDHLVPILRNGRIEEVYWTYSYGPAFGDDGSVAGVLVVCQETTPRVFTERRLASMNVQIQTERTRLSSLIAAAPAAMAVYSGPSHVITYVNKAWESVVGKPNVLGLTFAEAFPETRSGALEGLDRVYRTGEPWVETERRSPIQRLPDGPVEDAYWNLVCIRLDGSLGIGVADVPGYDLLVYAIDVTAQVVARLELESARAQAEDAMRSAESANRAKSEFLAMMSHELRTPLNAIAGYTELVEMEIHGPVTDDQREALRRIQRSERHLLGLVNGVLNYARLETGNLSYHVVDVDVEGALAECESLVTTQARSRNLRLTIEPCPSGARVKADAEKLQQILLNLLSNAVKFTGEGGSITVTCQVGSETVAIRASDTGRGIPPADAARIFEPFVQIDTKLTGSRDGVGLGLAISRELARAMHGDLTVESELGQGSTFILTLPRAPESPAPAASLADASAN